MGNGGRSEQMMQWADEPLTLYGVVGWAGQQRVGSQSGLGRLSMGDESRAVLMSAGVVHTRPDGATLEVTSHRRGGTHVEQMRSWAPINTLSAAMTAPGVGEEKRAELERILSDVHSGRQSEWLIWTQVTLKVHGQSTSFEVCEVEPGFWCAVGQAPDAHLTLQSRGVQLIGLALGKVDLEPPQNPGGFFHWPPKPDRHFPDALRSGAGWSEEPNVELTYEGYEALWGTMVGHSVELAMQVPHSHAGATGTLAGDEVTVTWVVADNSETHPDLTATMTGTFAGQPVRLKGVFHLGTSYFLDHADIEGTVAGQKLTARIVPASGGFSTSSTVAADGTLGAAEFGLYGAVNSSLTRAVVAGTVEGHSVRVSLEVRRNRARSVSIRGTWQGPLPLLALAVGSALYFV